MTQKPVVIAHRGASGYLPEHTLAAKAMAHAMGADYLEQDVVATRDDVLVVLHDIYLDRVSDVADRFPGRARDDGRYYVRDFDIAEVQTLRVSERFDADGNAVYPGRFPVRRGEFRIQTLEQELILVAHLNAGTKRNAGIYPEIKRPAWHKSEGVDIAPLLLAMLQRFGYTGHDDAVFLQCFDPGELERIRHELGSELKLVQLIGENDWQEADTDYLALRSGAGLARLAETVDGIGPWLPHCYEIRDGRPADNGFVAAAHAASLLVHPYTVRTDDLPAGFGDPESLLGFFAGELGVDGLFADFPDQVRLELGRINSSKKQP